MAMERSYQTFMLADEPKIAGIPVIMMLPCVVFTSGGMLVGLGYQGFVVGAIIALVLHFKFAGAGIRTFFSIVYWMMPHSVSMTLGLRRFPDSSKRIFLR